MTTKLNKISISLILIFISSLIAIAYKTDNLMTLFYGSFVFFWASIALKTVSPKKVEEIVSEPIRTNYEDIEIRIGSMKETQPKIYAKWQTFIGVKKSLESDLGFSLS